MLKPAADLKAKLSADEPVIGMMATDQAWPFLVEICRSFDEFATTSQADTTPSNVVQIGR